MNFQSWLTYERRSSFTQRNTLVRALYTGLLCWKLNSDQFSCRYIFTRTKADKVMHKTVLSEIFSGSNVDGTPLG